MCLFCSGVGRCRELVLGIQHTERGRICLLGGENMRLHVNQAAQMTPIRMCVRRYNIIIRKRYTIKRVYII